MEYKEQQKQHEKAADDVKRESFLKMCDDNERKQQENQQRHKEYFQRFDQNLGVRQVMHDMTVGEQERAKTRRLQDWEMNNAKMYQ